MTTFNGGYEASLARYNARKRELQTSMLEYSDHMRHLHTRQGNTSPRLAPKNNTSFTQRLRLELQDHHGLQQSSPRISDQDICSKNPKHQSPHLARVRPSSLDEKDLLCNAKNRDRPRRDTKSERPSGKATNSVSTLANLSLPQSLSQRNNVRISFVSASDLYDIVDIGCPRKSLKKEAVKSANIHQNVKLASGYNIDSRIRHKRNATFRGKIQNGGNSSSKSSYRKNNYCFNSLSKSSEILETIISEDKEKSNAAGDEHSPSIQTDSIENRDANTIASSGGTKNETSRPIDASNVLEHNNVSLSRADLESDVTDTHLKSRYKLKIRTRPKRAKRMQLHKSDLVVIPEDGGNFAANGDESKHALNSSNETVTEDGESKDGTNRLPNIKPRLVQLFSESSISSSLCSSSSGLSLPSSTSSASTSSSLSSLSLSSSSTSSLPSSSSSKSQANSLSSGFRAKETIQLNSTDTHSVSDKKYPLDKGANDNTHKAANPKLSYSENTPDKRNCHQVTGDKQQKTILKKPSPMPVFNRQGRQLEHLIVTNSAYSPLAMGKDAVESCDFSASKNKHVTFNSKVNKSSLQKQKLKRLVFLQDHPERCYRQEV